MQIIDYKSTPNIFDSARVATLVVATFASEQADKKELLRLIIDDLDHYAPLIGYPDLTADTLKQIKKRNMSEVSKLIMKSSGKYQAYLEAEPERARAINMVMCVARWPEWFIHKESRLEEIQQNMKDYLSDINAITYYDKGSRICPYSPELDMDHFDLYGGLRKQAKYIDQYCNSNGIFSNISVEAVISVLQDIKQEVQLGLSHDCFEEGFFESVKYIRGHIGRVVRSMHLYKTGRATASQFGLSESRSVVSDDPRIMNYLKLCGWSKKSCPNVLSNIFYPIDNQLDMEPQPGQIPVDRNYDYFTTAAGLGPAMKIRYVFNLLQMYQNYLTPLANLIGEADKAKDPIQESYTDQMAGLSGELPLVSDAYCIDATGYSDYLWRGIYSYLLELYMIPEEYIRDIMTIFAFPILVSGCRYNVKFGSMQGCKLLVFIMNHANRLIGIIARRLSDQKADYRHNAGDDTVTLIRKGVFEQSTIDNETKVFAIFNCAVNPLKTAHLDKDGYFDFCSKYFMRSGFGGCIGVSGIPPKLIGKQMLSIKSYTEIFRVLDVARVSRNPISGAWQICKVLLQPELTAGCSLPNALDERYTLEEKEELASEISYRLGGLAEEGEVDVKATAVHALKILQRMLIRYRFKCEGIYKVIQGIVSEDTELYKCLGSVEHLSLSRILNTISLLQKAIETGKIDEQDLKQACQLITQLDRCIIKGLSISSTSSTYHRITATRDIDNFIRPDEQPDFGIVNQLQKPEDAIQLAIMVAISAETFTDVDRLRHYAHAMQLLNSNRTRFYAERHGQYVNYYCEDDDLKRIKLTSKIRDVGPNNSGRYKAKEEMINQDLRWLCEYLDGEKQTLKILTEFEANMGTQLLMQHLHRALETVSSEFNSHAAKMCLRMESEIMAKQLSKIQGHV